MPKAIVYKLYIMAFIRKIKKGNAIYLAEVETVKVDGKNRQRHIRYVGKEVDGKTVLTTSISDVQIQEVKSYGDLIVLEHIAKKLDLHTLLGESSKEILSLVYAHCIHYKSLNKMTDWFARTDLNMILDIKNVTEKSLLEALDSLENINQETLQRDIFQAVQEKYNIKNSGVIYDVTNTYLYGSKCELGKLGKDKEGVKGRPLIQIGLGVTQEDGIPIFHKAFDGNIHDARTLQDLITSFRKYNIKKGCVILDRGITSAKNIAEIKDIGWDTVAGVPLNEAIKKFWSTDLGNNLKVFKNRVTLNKTKFYIKRKKYTLGNTSGYLYLCFNQQQQIDLQEFRRDEVDQAFINLKLGKKIKDGLQKFFNSKGEILQSQLDQVEKYDGFCCIFSTKKLENKELVSLYFEKKDVVEKAFRTLKGVVNLRPIRHWLYNRVVAHIFICYLSYLLLSLLKLSIKSLDMSAQEALNEMRSMYKVYLKDKNNTFNEARTVLMNKKQEAILKAIDKKLFKSCCSV